MARRPALALFAFAAVLACAGPPREEPAPGPLLWRAEGEEGVGSLFLLGSIHLGTADAPGLGPAVSEALERSQEVVVEVDLSRVSPAETLETTVRYGMLPPGRSLEDEVSPETWALLVAHLKARGVPVESFTRFRPWLAATTLALLDLQGAGMQAEHGVDRQLIGAAEGVKPLVALETMTSQFAMMAAIPPDLQELMLRESLERSDQTEAQSERLIASWQRGDEDALVQLFFGPLEEHPEYADLYEKIYFERNEAMARRLEELARDGKTRFVVLGAGHMVGPRGIPALLAQRGFRVERVR